MTVLTVFRRMETSRSMEVRPDCGCSRRSFQDRLWPVLTVNYDQIVDGVWVGSYPQQPEDVIHLKAEGVRAVLNLQSEHDFQARAIRWDLFWKFYVSQDIHVVRVPILDFDQSSLIENLNTAVDALHTQVEAKRPTYVHCTAGINRAPTVVISWLMRERGMALEEALTLVKTKRACHPYPEVLKQWAASLP